MTDATDFPSTDAFVAQTFAGSPLMAILRSAGVDRAVRVATTAWDLGLDSVEVTIQSDADVDALREVARLGRERGAVVGAGTIVSPEQVPVAVAAGAGYLVSPGLDADVVQAAYSAGIPILPGVATPSEVQQAVALELTWLKAFPAQWLGADWFRHIRGPFPQVRFIATGGMDAANAGAFLDAGVRVVAVGSALEDESQLSQLAALLAARR
ncbi:bifunctional 4-hydroxy-2-oxoglutarate aldolase/2-dehydro-3-deoxy-phosphogluconate aldolase [Microbacterium aurum]